METENKKNTNENTQINFKLAVKERQQIEVEAAKLGISLSEYCRIKCLLDERDTFIARNKVIELETVVNTLRVKLNYFKENERDPNDIVLKLTPEQREIIEKLYSEYYSRAVHIGENIIKALITFSTFEPIYLTHFNNKGLTVMEIEEAFMSDEVEEEE